MDRVTQQNAALVEEAAAAASSLQEQASGLRRVVSVFRLDNSRETSKGAAMLRRQVKSPQPPSTKSALGAPTTS